MKSYPEPEKEKKDRRTAKGGWEFNTKSSELAMKFRAERLTDCSEKTAKKGTRKKAKAAKGSAMEKKGRRRCRGGFSIEKGGG